MQDGNPSCRGESVGGQICKRIDIAKFRSLVAGRGGGLSHEGTFLLVTAL
jgi:hypothetical protein